MNNLRLRITRNIHIRHKVDDDVCGSGKKYPNKSKDDDFFSFFEFFIIPRTVDHSNSPPSDCDECQHSSKSNTVSNDARDCLSGRSFIDAWKIFRGRIDRDSRNMTKTKNRQNQKTKNSIYFFHDV